MWQTIIHKWLKAPYILNAEEFQAPTQQVATVILLHGIGSSMNMWRPAAKKLPTNVRIIALDLLGFGESPKPGWDVYSARTQADSVATTLFTMKIVGPVVIVGHSLGSLVAIEFARRYPLMTKSLVLISPPLYKLDRPFKRFAFKPDQVISSIHEIMQENPFATERILRMAGKYRLVNKGFSPDGVNVPAFLASLRMAIINQTSYRDILRIKRPIHIISGKLDPIVLTATLKDLAAKRPNITWQAVLGSHEVLGVVQATTVKAINLAIDEARARADRILT